MAELTDAEKVRLLVGDTDEDDELLSDDEVDALLEHRTIEIDDETVHNLPAAAADAAAAIAAKFSREFSFAEDGQQFQRAQKAGHYLALERRLRALAGGTSVPIGPT